MLGSVVANDPLALTFLALAAGSIFCVLVQLIAVARDRRGGYLTYIGLFAGFGTDFVVTAAGV